MPRGAFQGRRRRRQFLGLALAGLLLLAWWLAKSAPAPEPPPQGVPLAVPPPSAPSSPTASIVVPSPAAEPAAPTPRAPSPPLAPSDLIDEGRLYRDLKFDRAGGERFLPDGAHIQTYTSPMAPHLKVEMESDPQGVRKLTLDFAPEFRTRENDFLAFSLALDETLSKLLAPSGSDAYKAAGQFIMDHLRDGTSGEQTFAGRAVRVECTEVGSGRISLHR